MSGTTGTVRLKSAHFKRQSARLFRPFLAINSRRVPLSNDGVLDRYAAAAGIDVRDRARHDALAALCGLVLRGWRKALDADEGEPDELRWWCERAREGMRFL